MRILIAEDDFTSRSVLTAVLRKEGHEVVETVNGAQAWEELQGPDAPRLAILDWMMPEMDGLEVVRRVRAVETKQPPFIIMLTTKSEKADTVAGLDAGADDYLAKPFDARELAARLRSGQRIIELGDALARQATLDALTGVLNRRGILDALSAEMARAKRTGTRVGVGMCDLDKFKRINDTYGHLAGDDVLCEVARRMRGHLREYDLIGRYGGEEFLLIIPNALEAGGGLGCPYERVRREVAGSPVSTYEGDVAVTLSIGVADTDGSSILNEVLAVADAALYRAKEEGRNRIVCAVAQGTCGDEKG